MKEINEYQKIENIFTYSGKKQVDISLSNTYYALKNLTWEGTEKIDGTNTRIYWDGHRVSIYGATSNSEWDPEVYSVLETIFLTPEFENAMEATFGEKEVYLFGETYGKKLNGGAYTKNSETNFVLFDVNVDGWDLRRPNINSVAEKLGLNSVPVVFTGTLEEAIRFMYKNPKTALGDNGHEMEGLVLVPKDIQLYNNKKKEIKVKCKIRDIRKYENYLQRKTKEIDNK